MIYVDDNYRCSQIFDCYLFADDTNLLHSDIDLKDLERAVNEELIKVADWLDANKLSLNTSKSNFAIFRPCQHKPDCKIQLKICNNGLKNSVPLEQKTFVKYQGIRMDRWMDRRTDRRTDVRTYVCMYVCVYVCRICGQCVIGWFLF